MDYEKEFQLDDLVQRIGEVFKSTQKLAQQAVQIYSVEVEDILEAQTLDVQRIERFLRLLFRRGNFIAF